MRSPATHVLERPKGNGKGFTGLPTMHRIYDVEAANGVRRILTSVTDFVFEMLIE